MNFWETSGLMTQADNGEVDFIKNLFNLLFEFIPFLDSISSIWTIHPSIIGAGTDSHNATQYFHRVRLLLHTNKCISYSASFAKKTAAFFNISRSIRNCLFSLRN